MFLCGLFPVVVSLVTLFKVKEPERWEAVQDAAVKRVSPFKAIFGPQYRRRTLVMSTLLTVAIIGLWAGSVYEPAAAITLAKGAGYAPADAVRFASYGTAILSIGTVLGCLALPVIAERLGRRATLALFFSGMLAFVALSFGWAFYLPPARALPTFLVLLFFLGFAGANFALFSLWLPELFGTEVRATAFAFCTSVGRFVGAGVNFALGAAVHGMGPLGTPVAWTAVAFGLGLIVIPFAVETRGQPRPR